MSGTMKVSTSSTSVIAVLLIFSNGPKGLEEKMIKFSEAVRAAKQEQWEEGGRWWNTLKSGDMSLYSGGSSLRT